MAVRQRIAMYMRLPAVQKGEGEVCGLCSGGMQERKPGFGKGYEIGNR